MIAPLPESLRNPNVPAPSTLRFVRPPILDGHGPGHDVAERRSLVYVTLGTVFNLESGDLLPRLVHAMNLLTATDDVDVVITTGHHIHRDDLPPPAARCGSRSSCPSENYCIDVAPSCVTQAQEPSWTPCPWVFRSLHSRSEPTSPTTPTAAKNSASV